MNRKARAEGCKWKGYLCYEAGKRFARYPNTSVEKCGFQVSLCGFAGTSSGTPAWRRVDGVADGRIAYVANNGDGPFGDCEWEPPVNADQAYF